MVGTCCSVADCYNRQGKPGISFHRFPTNPVVRKQWASLCKRGDKFNLNTSSICSIHFKPEDFMRDLQAELLGYNPKRRLFPGRVPSENIPHNPNKPKTESGIKRQERMKAKKARQDHLDALEGSFSWRMPEQEPESENVQISPDIEEIQPQDEEEEVVPILDYKLLYEETKNLNAALREKLKAQSDELKRANRIVKRLSNQNQKMKNNNKKLADRLKDLKFTVKTYKNIAQRKARESNKASGKSLWNHMSES